MSCLWAGSKKSSSLPFAAFIVQKGLLPFDCRPASARLVQLFVVVVQRFPFLSFDSSVNGLTKGVPGRIHWRRSPSLEPNMGRIDEGSQRTHFFNSHDQFVGAFSDNRLWIRIAGPRFLCPRRLGTSTQAAHIPCKYNTSNDVFSRCKIVHKMAARKQ